MSTGGGRIISGLLLAVAIAATSAAQTNEPPLYRPRLTAAQAQQLVKPYETLDRREFALELPNLVELDSDVARLLGRSVYGLSLPKLATLSAAAAEQLALAEGPLSFGALESLTPEAATHLGKCRHSLEFPRLVPTLEVLAALAPHNRNLTIGGLRELDEPSAAILTRHRGRLFLPALESLSDGAAAQLAGSSSDLQLDRLAQLSPAAAESLAKHRGGLSLNGLRSLDNEALAATLCQSPNAAQLPMLSSISPGALRVLSERATYLTLGLRELSAEQLEILGRFQGSLTLPVIHTVSDSTASILAARKGSLKMYGLRELHHEPLARKLAASGGSMPPFLTLAELSPAAARVIVEASQRRHLRFPRLETLSEDVARELAKAKGQLSLPAVPSLTPAAAAALAAHDGSLSLPTITAVSPEVAEGLSQHAGPLEMVKLVRLDHPGLAERLAGRSTSLRGVESVSDEVLVRLVAAKRLTLGIREITERQAVLLARCTDSLSLPNVERVSPAVITWLANRSGSLSLPKLVELRDERLARALVQGASDTIELGEVRSLSTAAADELAKSKQGLNLDGLTEVTEALARALALHTGHLSLRGATTFSGAAIIELSRHRAPVSCQDNPALSMATRELLIAAGVFIRMRPEPIVPKP